MMMTDEDDDSFQLFAGDGVQEEYESGDQCIDSVDNGSSFQLFAAAADGVEELESADQCIIGDDDSTFHLFDEYIQIIMTLFFFFFFF